MTITFTNPATMLAGRLNWEWSERGLCEHFETMIGAALHYANPAGLIPGKRLGGPIIIELGVRTGVSSAIWLAAIEKAGGGLLWSYDIEAPHGDYVHQILGHPNWVFNLGDDLEMANGIPGDDADILFIDTSHTYEHTLAELRLYAPFVQPEGVIFLHDSNVEVTTEGETWSVRKAIDTYINETSIPRYETVYPFERRKESDRLWTVEDTYDRFGLALMTRA